ncbi:MAG TPA: hypothetical protein VKB88_21890 [Bryobacteraceae bacterium]|nr:hypothetical protein [Bryobacteraceae bacterium]
MAKTTMRVAFARNFPDLIGTAFRSFRFDGMDGGACAQGAVLPRISWQVAGLPLAFRGMAVYLKGPGADYFEGMSGNERTGKAREFTLDGGAMRLMLP